MILFRQRSQHLLVRVLQRMFTASHLLFVVFVGVLVVLGVNVYQAYQHQQADASRQLPGFVSQTHTLPVVLLTTDPKNLWDEQSGIYTNYTKEGDDWERPATLTFFEADGTFGFEQAVGIRIHGGGSTAHPQKSFRIYGEYLKHQNPISYSLFPDLPYQRFRSIILRAGGGDWEYAFIRDSLAHTLATQATDLDTQAVRPAVLYLNGEYWGLYNIRERYDQGYVQYKYGLDPSKIAIIDIPHTVDVNRGEAVLDFGKDKSAADDYNKILRYGENCTTCADINQVGKEMDIDNLIEYYFVELYTGNFDWPFGNVKLWRYRQPKFSEESVDDPIDGKFRWLLYDLDVGFGFSASSSAEMQKKAAKNAYNRFLDDQMPFRNLFHNETFQQRYLTRVAELLNGPFSQHHVTTTIDQVAAEIRPEIKQHLERWHDQAAPFGTQVVGSVEEWEREVSLLKDFAQYRPEEFFKQTVTEFKLSGLQQITLSAEPTGAGGINVGRLEYSPDELPQTGTFFSDTYMAVEAVPSPGYTFDHWQGDMPAGSAREQRVVIKLADRTEITAVYRKRRWFEIL